MDFCSRKDSECVLNTVVLDGINQQGPDFVSDQPVPNLKITIVYEHSAIMSETNAKMMCSTLTSSELLSLADPSTLCSTIIPELEATSLSVAWLQWL